MPIDVKALGAELAQVVAAEIAPLTEKIKALQAEIDLLKAAPPAKDGKDGTSVTIEDVQPLIDAAVKALPAPKDGKDGMSVTLEDVAPLIEQAVKALPPAAPGKDGMSVTLEDVAPLIEQAVKALPPAAPGKDGVGVAGAMIDREGSLLLTLTNGEVKNLGRVVGKDGVSFEDFTLAYDAENHEVVVKAQSGGVAKEVRAPIRGITLGGYWRDGTKAKAQEAWSHGGCLWVAKCDTSSKPDATSGDWVLAARKGRDGEGVERAAPTTGPVKLGA